jgi:hypothetical protein
MDFSRLSDLDAVIVYNYHWWWCAFATCDELIPKNKDERSTANPFCLRELPLAEVSGKGGSTIFPKIQDTLTKVHQNSLSSDCQMLLEHHGDMRINSGKKKVIDSDKDLVLIHRILIYWIDHQMIRWTALFIHICQVSQPRTLQSNSTSTKP